MAWDKSNIVTKTYYQWCLICGIYMFDPWERIVFHIGLFAMVAFGIFATFSGLRLLSRDPSVSIFDPSGWM
jgi:hypothetical protein